MKTTVKDWFDGCPGQDAVHEMALGLISLAQRVGVVVTIERQPLKPLAMGHAEYVIETRPVRGEA